MSISLRQIRYFVAAAETRKVSEAATQLGISQSAISVAIKDLENYLGLQLITRRVGGIDITRDGAKFLNYARNIESNVEEAVHSMKSREETTSGHFRLGVTYTGVGYFLLPILSRFRRSYPDIIIDMIEMTRPEIEKSLLNRTIDLALVIVSNLSDGNEIEINYKSIFSSPRLLWLSSQHPLCKKDNIYLADLEEIPYVQFMSDEANISASKYLFPSGFVPNTVLRTTSMEAVRGMVATGAAITILASLVYRPWSLDGGRVELRPLKDPIPSLDLGIAWRASHHLSEAEIKFLSYLDQRRSNLT
jgi:DNA-binding transcriptional LysR family regulator